MWRVFILMFFVFVIGKSYSQSSEHSFKSSEDLPAWFRNQTRISNVADAYSISEELEPFYLEADFNGQGRLDIAIFILEKKSLKKGILIQHREDSTLYILGAGHKIRELDDFSWMDHWQINRKPTAEQTVFNEDFDIIGSKTIQVPNIAIEVSSSESPSNLITWNGLHYTWIHTGD